MQQQHLQEALAVGGKRLAAERLVAGHGLLILHTGLVGHGLPYNVDEVVFVVVVATILVGHTGKERGGAQYVVGVVIVRHLRPARCLEIVGRWPSAENALVRPLLVVAHRTVVDGGAQQLPSLLERGVVGAVAGAHVALEPLLLAKLRGAPGQLAHQFEHHRVVF